MEAALARQIRGRLILVGSFSGLVFFGLMLLSDRGTVELDGRWWHAVWFASFALYLIPLGIACVLWVYLRRRYGHVDDPEAASY